MHKIPPRQMPPTNKELPQILANLSHELRGSLYALMARAEMLKSRLRENKPENCGQMLSDVDRILAAANHIEALLKRALQAQTEGSPQAQKIQEAFDVAGVLKECCELYGPIAQRKGLRFSFQFDLPENKAMGLTDRSAGSRKQSGETLLIGDALGIRQILMNLLSNAVKYTESGEIKVYAHLHSDGAESESKNSNLVMLSFTVKDTGIGMSKEQIDSAFYRGVRHQPSAAQGLGLGLDIAQSIAKEMDGEIHVQSAPQKGSEFHVRIPLTESRSLI